MDPELKVKLINYINSQYPEDGPERDFFIISSYFTILEDGNLMRKDISNYVNLRYRILSMKYSSKTNIEICCNGDPLFSNPPGGSYVKIGTISSPICRKGKSKPLKIYAIDLFPSSIIQDLEGSISLVCDNSIILKNELPVLTKIS
jgi:hypothetical protein